MNNATYFVCKIKKGKRGTWEKWCNALMKKHYPEASETLVEEDLREERCVLFDIGKSSYVLYIHTPLKGKKKKPANPNRALNVKHYRKFHECLTRLSDAELGYLVTHPKFVK